MKQKLSHTVALGLQHADENSQARLFETSKSEVEVPPTSKAFPRPQGHCYTDTLSFAGLLVALTLTVAIIWNFENFDWTIRQVTFFFLTMLLGLIPIVWAYHLLYPRFDRKRVQKGKLKAMGRVVATDHAGKMVEDDAQQRALVEVFYQDKRYLLVANQPGLSVAPNTDVAVTWHSISQLCWIHEMA